MGVFSENAIIGASAAGDYDIDQSLRFEDGDSPKLTRTPSSAGNRKTYTLSFWTKLSQGSNGIGFGQYSDSSNRVYFRVQPAGFSVYSVSGGSANCDVSSPVVFRDPSAWYHIVIVVDTTESTASNRIKLWVNGSSITLTHTTSWTQNTDTRINDTNEHTLGLYNNTAYPDGYLAEVNFIDGTALTPASFGETDADTNQWKAIEYEGSYGTNGFNLPFSNGTSWSNYFDFSGDYIRVPSSVGAPFDFGTGDFTIEGWFYLTTSGSWTSYYGISQGGGASQKINLYDSTGDGTLDVDINGGTRFSSSAVLTDLLNKWAHIALVREGTGANETKLYVNGSVVGQGTSSDNFSGFTQPFTIGHNGELYSGAFKGFISNFRVVKGTAVYTGSFTPPTSDLTAISGTQLLTCQNSTFIDNSSNNLTVTVSGDTRTEKFSPIGLDFSDDHSGNGNNFAPINSAYTDVVLDSPTNNFSTLNPLDPAANHGTSTFKEGNLRIDLSGGNYKYSAVGNGAMSTGKWYFEFCAINSDNSQMLGVADITKGLDRGYTGLSGDGLYIYVDGDKYSPTSSSSYGVSWTYGDVMGIAVDMDNNAMYFAKNNTWMNSGDPTSGASKTGAAYTTELSGKTWVAAMGRGGLNGTNSGTFNFGQDSSFAGAKTSQGNQDGNDKGDFYYAPPAGYLALCTDNLSDPSIDDPTDHFVVNTYSGNGSSQTINTVFAPDLAWVKRRDTSGYHIWTDTVRGAGNYLVSNVTDAESSGGSQLINAFTSSGFTVGTEAAVNNSSGTYVGWAWKAGGTAVSNTDGTTTSSVSANTTAGFSIVTCTTLAGTQSVGHGLSQAPEIVIQKPRNVVQNWYVYYDFVDGTQDYLILNTTAAKGAWGGSAATSTVFYENWSAGNNLVCYCFHSVEGYSKIGKYIGNASTDGPFVYTGFRPAWVILKNVTTGGGGYNWVINDSKRVGYNADNKRFRANTAGQEDDTGRLDIFSNGFKLTQTYTEANQSGANFIYMAFAEIPFKYSNAR